MSVSPASRTKLVVPRLFWGLMLIWGISSVLIADRLSEHMKFRINDLSVIPGAGMIMRDIEGTFYHVNASRQARPVYPNLASAYGPECLECVLVTGEQMSKTNDFCAAGVRSDLPDLSFELPCQSWAVMGDGTKVVAVTLFLLPLLLWPVLRALIRFMAGKPGR